MTATKHLPIPSDYPSLLNEVKQRLKRARVRVALSANTELIQLYWDMGQLISKRLKQAGWGKQTIERLATDIRKTFPELKGFSTSNLWRMRAFYEAYSGEPEKLAQAVRELEIRELAQAVREREAGNEISKLPPLLGNIPWGHNLVLVEKVKELKERYWYVQKTIENSWSRNILVNQIESGLYSRQGGAVTNFPTTLTEQQSDLAQNLLKDPYTFEFLGLTEDVAERELEKSLLDHIKKFLLELGKGFAFLESQYHLEVGDQDYFLDLLFYHTTLRCHIVIDLKIGEFLPEYTGKMAFYLDIVEDQLKHADDHPPIGIILCKERNKVIVEYSLKTTTQAVAVTTYHLGQALPAPVSGALPSAEELEAELEKGPGNGD